MGTVVAKHWQCKWALIANAARPKRLLLSKVSVSLGVPKRGGLTSPPLWPFNDVPKRPSLGGNRQFFVQEAAHLEKSLRKTRFKNGRFVTHICFFKKMPCRNPYFYSVFWVRVFGQVVKKGKFWTPKNKRKIWLITEKLIFWYFVFFSFFVCFFFGGFKGQVRWPEGPPHLALNLPYYYLLFCFISFFVFFFPLFASNRKTCFPLEKGNFCLFLGVSLCFSLAFFGLPLFQLHPLCLSLVFFFFLLVFLFCFLFIPCFSLFLSFYFFFAFVSWK